MRNDIQELVKPNPALHINTKQQMDAKLTYVLREIQNTLN